MERPYRRYCMSLVERLGYRKLEYLWADYTSNEVMEWLAYDMTMSNDFIEKHNKEQQSKEITPQEQEAAVKAMFASIGK
jgi:hypothetical protein